jgi:hypothetical protein
MKKTIITTSLLIFLYALNAQPYLDIVNVKYMQSPDYGLFNQSNNKEKLAYLNTSFNIPVKCKPINGIVIINPFFEQWDTEISNISNPVSHFQNIAMSVTFLDTVSTHKIRLAISPIVRMENFSKDGTGSAQLGVAGLAIFHSKKVNYKVGFYINGEYFNDFFVPLFGIDWNISKKDKLFGILPGSLTYEHRIANGFYWGAAFRSITNSYRELENNYFRVNDNQLGIYTDFNIAKQIVLTAEAGHSFFRKLIIGQKNVFTNDLKVNDNMYFRLSIAYRIRFSS